MGLVPPAFTPLLVSPSVRIEVREIIKVIRLENLRVSGMGGAWMMALPSDPQYHSREGYLCWLLVHCSCLVVADGPGATAVNPPQTTRTLDGSCTAALILILIVIIGVAHQARRPNLMK